MSKRDIVKVRGKSRYVQMDKDGKFEEITNIGKSIGADSRKKAAKVVKPGHGHEGDLKPRKK